MKRILLFVCLAAIFLFCTKKSPVDPPPKWDGTFIYTAFDSAGTEVVRGWFTMISKDSASIAGVWHFDQVAESYPVGPQIGDGELVGHKQGDELWIDLNPGMADNNVGLYGKVTGETIRGTWEWITFIGPTTGGQFTAVKN